MMNDNEILKALECCKDLKCSECPKKTNLFKTDCDVQLCQEAIALINSQKAQIEGLQDEVVTKTDMLNEQKAEMEKFERIVFYGYEVIKKQEAEIERYLHSIKLFEKDVQTAKSEAIKEFAKNFEKKIKDVSFTRL